MCHIRQMHDGVINIQYCRVNIRQLGRNYGSRRFPLMACAQS